MKQVDRERITAALMGESAQNFPALCKELEEICSEEVSRLEPIIDDIVQREVSELARHLAVAAAPRAPGVEH